MSIPELSLGDKFLVIICLLVSASSAWGDHYDDYRPDDMTTWVEMTESTYGNWYLKNTSDKLLVCQIGLQSPPRWSTNLPRHGQGNHLPLIGSRTFDLEPGQTYKYAKNDVGSLYCVQKRKWGPLLQ